jgi:hypothetical protein
MVDNGKGNAFESVVNKFSIKDDSPPLSHISNAQSPANAARMGERLVDVDREGRRRSSLREFHWLAVHSPSKPTGCADRLPSLQTSEPPDR